MTEKHAGGRPRKFQSVEEMDAVIDAYFLKCDTRIIQVVTRKGDVVDVKHPEPYTVTGLALALDVDRATLLRYEKEEREDIFGEEFCNTVKRAKERIHHDLERRLYDGEGYGPGHIFGLKNNYDWKDTRDVSSSGNITLTVVYDEPEDPSS